MKMRKYFLAVIAIILVMLEPVAASATQKNEMPDIDNMEKSLTIYFYVQKSGVDVPISGAEIGIYRVADLNCKNGSANYTFLPDFDELKKTENGRDITFDGLSVSESEKLSESLAALVKTPDKSGTTDKFGNITFENIPQGMYLVQELSTKGDASNYEKFAPYLISVPYPVMYEDSNYWKYDVISEPKTKVEAKNSDSDTDTDTDTDTSTDTEVVTDTDTDISTDTNTNTDTSTDTGKSTQTSSSSTSTASTVIRDSSKVTTGFVSNVMMFLMIMFGSATLIAFSVNRKQKEEDDETT